MPRSVWAPLTLTQASSVNPLMNTELATPGTSTRPELNAVAPFGSPARAPPTGVVPPVYVPWRPEPLRSAAGCPAAGPAVVGWGEAVAGGGRARDGGARAPGCVAAEPLVGERGRSRAPGAVRGREELAVGGRAVVEDRRRRDTRGRCESRASERHGQRRCDDGEEDDAPQQTPHRTIMRSPRRGRNPRPASFPRRSVHSGPPHRLVSLA